MYVSTRIHSFLEIEQYPDLPQDMHMIMVSTHHTGIRAQVKLTDTFL